MVIELPFGCCRPCGVTALEQRISDRVGSPVTVTISPRQFGPPVVHAEDAPAFDQVYQEVLGHLEEWDHDTDLQGPQPLQTPRRTSRPAALALQFWRRLGLRRSDGGKGSQGAERRGDAAQ